MAMPPAQEVCKGVFKRLATAVAQKSGGKADGIIVVVYYAYSFHIFSAANSIAGAKRLRGNPTGCARRTAKPCRSRLRRIRPALYAIRGTFSFVS
ncbi:MAG: hypothetical protein A2451_14330 [Bdellovibrionales bacterium RIFOXYC2_FULL_39_8]|nr:MAG: hypothetical protein A2451_14330 [Bdellovibrionales bacterium RIFOXYC2_FULL_39_8]